MSFIPDVDLDLRNLPKFYDTRRKLLLEELKNKLGFVDPVEPPEDTVLRATGEPLSPAHFVGAIS